MNELWDEYVEAMNAQTCYEIELQRKDNDTRAS
mgnify:CR=1 FL=1|jgi:hypothetical protein